MLAKLKFLIALVLATLAFTAWCASDNFQLLLRNSKDLRYSDTDSALVLAHTALRTALQIDSAFYIGESSNNLGILYKNKEMYDSALYYYHQAFRSYSADNNEEKISGVYNNMANVHKYKVQNDSALSYYLKSLAIREQVNYRLGTTYNNLGNFYNEVLEEKNQAIEYYEEAIAESTNDADSTVMALAYMNSGIVLGELGQYERAHQNLLKAEDICLKTENTYTLAKVYFNLGILFKSQGINERSAEYLVKAQMLYKTHNDIDGLIRVILILSGQALEDGQLGLAIERAEYGDSLSTKASLPRFRIDFVRILSDCSERMGNLEKAYQYGKIEMLLTDSLYHIDTRKEVESLRTQYETEKKEQQIVLQEAELQVKEANLTAEVAQKNGLMITLIVTACLVLVIVYFYQQRQKTIVSLRDKDRTLHNQQVDDLLKEGEINSLNALMEGQEVERVRIAEDLHDRLGSMLSAVKLNYSAVKPQPQQQEQLEKAASILDETIDETRKIAHNLASGVLSKFGLVAALNDLKDKIEGSRQIEMEVLGHNLKRRFSTELEVNLYRAVQELVSNILKHADASKITVQITVPSSDTLTIMVEDDGRGFDPKSVTNKGMGLGNLEARVTKLDGTITIDSFPGRGTTTIIEIPIHAYA